jgi:hypothetical protein
VSCSDNSQGDIIWFRFYGDTLNTNVTSSADAVCRSADGNYIVAGIIDSVHISDHDFLVFKVNDDGDTLWSHTFELPGYQSIANIQPISDGYFLFGSGGHNVDILKIDEEGGLLSYRGVDSAFVACSAAYQLPSGNLLVGGRGQGAFALACVSSADTLLWLQSWGPPANEYVEDMKPTADGGSIIVGRTASHGANVWDFYAVRTGSVEEPSAATEAPMPPLSFSLSNFPNPFNSSTEILYEVAKAGKVRLSVFDLLGREVAVLEDGMVSAGSHRVIFDGKDLASGEYIYRLQTAEGARADKMVLLK